MRVSIIIIGMITTCGSTIATEKIRIKTAKIGAIATYPERSAPAAAISLNNSIISAQIKSVVKKLPPRICDIVEKGDVLAELDCTDYQLAYRQSAAILLSIATKRDLAERRLQRTRLLTVEQSVAEEVLDTHESDYAVLNAEWEKAKAEIEGKKLDESRCLVVSPFRALVIKRNSAVGELANIGTALMQIIDVNNIEVTAQLLNRDIDQIKQINTLHFVHENIRYPVTLRSIVNAIDMQTRNREARLTFNDKVALPGATGQLVWHDQRAHISYNLLVRRYGQLGVFTFADDKVHFNPMPKAQVGQSNITTLVNETDIVIEGHFALT